MAENGIHKVEPDWQTLRNAFDQSVGPRARSAARDTSDGWRGQADGRAYGHSSVVAGNDACTTEEGQGAMEYSVDGLRRDNRAGSRRAHKLRPGKGDVDNIATLMSAVVASIVIGTLIARYWLAFG